MRSVRVLLAGKKRIQPESKRVLGSSTNPIQKSVINSTRLKKSGPIEIARVLIKLLFGKRERVWVKIYTTSVWERKILISNTHKNMLSEMQLGNDNRFKSGVVMKTKANAVKYDRLAGGRLYVSNNLFGLLS